MPATHRIFGSELSPYSVKVRSYFRYKGIPHEWLERGPSNIAEYQKHAKLPLIPLVITPDEQGLQDSTPILETMEARVPEPSIHPTDEALAFLSALVEEFGDEWGNKWMFHYRWARAADQDSAAERMRLPLFEALVVHVEDPLEGQRAFHAHRWPRCSTFSVLMCRSDARTVSRSTIDVRAGVPSFAYEPLDFEASCWPSQPH